MIQVINEKRYIVNNDDVDLTKPVILKSSRIFKSADALEEYRRKKQMMAQYKMNQSYLFKHPGLSEDDLKELAPKIEILLDTAEISEQ